MHYSCVPYLVFTCKGGYPTVYFCDYQIRKQEYILYFHGHFTNKANDCAKQTSLHTLLWRIATFINDYSYVPTLLFNYMNLCPFPTIARDIRCTLFAPSLSLVAVRRNRHYCGERVDVLFISGFLHPKTHHHCCLAH